MKITRIQIERLVRKVLNELHTQKVMTVKVPEDKIFQRAVEALDEDLRREHDLDREVNLMLDDLERKNPGTFQRFKMFTLLKKRLAQEKGIVL